MGKIKKVPSEPVLQKILRRCAASDILPVKDKTVIMTVEMGVPGDYHPERELDEMRKYLEERINKKGPGSPITMEDSNNDEYPLIALKDLSPGNITEKLWFDKPDFYSKFVADLSEKCALNLILSSTYIRNEGYSLWSASVTTEEGTPIPELRVGEDSQCLTMQEAIQDLATIIYKLILEGK